MWNEDSWIRAYHALSAVMAGTTILVGAASPALSLGDSAGIIVYGTVAEKV